MSQGSRRIPKGTERADKIVAGRTMGDVAIFIGLPIMLGALGMYIDYMSALEFFLYVLILVVVNGLLFRAVPANESLTLWVRGLGHYIKTPSLVTSNVTEDTIKFDDDLPYDVEIETDGGTVERDDLTESLWKEETNLTDITGIKNVFRDSPYILRTDGLVVGAVEVSGRDISLASEEHSRRLIVDNGKQLNSLDFDMVTYITDSEFDLEAHIDHLRDRLSDQDMQERPILAEVTKSNIRRLVHSTQTMGLRERRAFCIAMVDPDESQTGENDTPFTLIDPDTILGDLLGIDSPGANTEDRKYVEARDELDTRLRNLVSSLERIDNVNAHIIDSATYANLVHDHVSKQAPAESNWVPQDSPLLLEPDESQAPQAGEIFN